MLQKVLFLFHELLFFFDKYDKFSAHPSSKTVKTFYDAKFEVTDFGACCAILPYLNFVNPETAEMSPDEYTGEQWHYQKKGAQVSISSMFKEQLLRL